MASTALADRMKTFSQPNSNVSGGIAGFGHAAKSTAPPRWGATSSAHDTISKVAANDPSLLRVDLSSSAIFQMKSDEFMSQLSDALKGNSHVRDLVLTNCNIGLKGCEYLADAFTRNNSIVSVNLEKNAIHQDGASALAKGLAHNKSVTSINLMDQKNTRWGDKCLDDFLETFQTNITLLKITWRLESRKSFALNKMITRNNEIDRRKKCGMPYDDLLPTQLKKGGAVGMPLVAGEDASASVRAVQDEEHASVVQTGVGQVSDGKENVVAAASSSLPSSDNSSLRHQFDAPTTASTSSSYVSNSSGGATGGVAARWQPPAQRKPTVVGGSGTSSANIDPAAPTFVRPKRSANSVLNRWPPGGDANQAS